MGGKEGTEGKDRTVLAGTSLGVGERADPPPMQGCTDTTRTVSTTVLLPVRDPAYFMCLLTNLVISNMLTCALPLKIGKSFASALIIRRFWLSCRSFRLM